MTLKGLLAIRHSPSTVSRTKQSRVVACASLRDDHVMAHRSG